ncbi:APC family permease [Sporosarcina sp. YIM B06819]|uniref:APC family permease n=1 Tax=Sporosarcina sp. YIM B06819 TaxID=3081769 RepID=UPI00298C3F74|nr:APC family permease [Sporosarcina sp. YIM B06819]
MKFKSGIIVIAIGLIFVIAAVYRLFGYSVPSSVVALISVIAALISLSDVLDITKLKKYTAYVQGIALIFFVIAMIMWLFPNLANSLSLPIIGDGFTILGLGFVIGLYGWKEILESKKVNEIKVNNEYKYKLTEFEYLEMMQLNDIIERLKNLDREFFPYNKVHDGWALFNDSLAEHWNKWKGPFYDGMNRKNYFEFLSALDQTAEKIGDVADPDFRYFNTRQVKMWGDSIEVTSQPRMNNIHIASMDDVSKEIQKVLILWDKVKNPVTKRYEEERAEEKGKSS